MHFDFSLHCPNLQDFTWKVDFIEIAWHWHEQAGGGRLWGTRASQSLPRSPALEENRRPRYCPTSPARIPQIIAPPPHLQRNPAPALCFNIWYPANSASCQPVFPACVFCSNSLFSADPSLSRLHQGVEKVLVWFTIVIEVHCRLN